MSHTHLVPRLLYYQQASVGAVARLSRNPTAEPLSPRWSLRRRQWRRGQLTVDRGRAQAYLPPTPPPPEDVRRSTANPGYTQSPTPRDLHTFNLRGHPNPILFNPACIGSRSRSYVVLPNSRALFSTTSSTACADRAASDFAIYASDRNRNC